MRLTNVKVRNFRCFSEREWVLNPRFNLLVGENGSGKTVALEAFACALGAWLKGLPKVKERPLEESDIRTVSRLNGEQLNEETQSLASIFVRAELEGVMVQWRRERFLMERSSSEGMWEILDRARAAASAVAEGLPVTLPLLSYYGTGRLFALPNEMKSSAKAEKSRFNGYAFSLDPRMRVDQIFRWFNDGELLALQYPGESNTFRVVKEAIVQCIEGCRDIRYDAKHRGVMISFSNGEYHEFKVLSDGQRNMLAMVADIAMKASELNPGYGPDVLNQTPGVVLIDELDLHLHPRWQRRIIGDLKRTFPRIQFIATTHSPFLIQALEPGELIKLGEGVLPDEPQEYKKQSIEDIAIDHMGMKEEHVARSREYHLKMRAAEEYFRKLREPGTTPSELEALEAEYLRRLEPFGDDPAFFAALKIERESQGGASNR